MLPSGVVRGRKNPLFVGFGKRLKQARKSQNLSRFGISARASAKDRELVASLEAGERIPRIDTVEKLAYALGLSPAFLAYGLDFPCVRSRDGFLAEGVATRLQSARVELGLSMRALARSAGLTDTAVRSTETGSTIPGLETTERLAVALGVSPGWLAYGLGPVELPNRRAIRSKPAQAQSSESNTSADSRL